MTFTKKRVPHNKGILKDLCDCIEDRCTNDIHNVSLTYKIGWSHNKVVNRWYDKRKFINCLSCKGYKKTHYLSSRFCTIQCANDYQYYSYIRDWKLGINNGSQSDKRISNPSHT